MAKLTRVERQRRERQRAIAAIAGVAILAIGLGVVAWAARPEPLDPVTLCVKGRPVSAHTTVLVDKTDFPSPAHVAALVRGISRLKSEIGRNELLSIRVVGAKGDTAAKPIFLRCNPGDGSDVSRWWGNPGQAQAQWEASFGMPLAKVLEDQLLADQQTKWSAIFEAIDTTLWDDSFGAQVLRRRIVIVSDLMQNMPGHRHYERVPRVDEFLASPIGKRLKTKVWAGLNVDLTYLPDVRAPHLQGDKHIKFWLEVFRRLGVGSVRVLPPFGGTPVARN
jgi:hypothetical protein